MAKRNKRRNQKVVAIKAPVQVTPIVESVYVPKRDRFAEAINTMAGYIDAFVSLFYKVA
jgi:hypothetical protein